jgi:hypothetical protein
MLEAELTPTISKITVGVAVELVKLVDSEHPLLAAMAEKESEMRFVLTRRSFTDPAVEDRDNPFRVPEVQMLVMEMALAHWVDLESMELTKQVLVVVVAG